jgi:hypothetical protein
MLAVLIAALMGQPAGYAFPESVLLQEPWYQKCLDRHNGASRIPKCACLATYMSTNPSDPDEMLIGFNLMFQYYTPAAWELEAAYGVDNWKALNGITYKARANSVCYFSPKYPEGGLQD